MIPYPTSAMKIGRRCLEEIPEITLLKDWTWEPELNVFYLYISISLEMNSSDIPQTSNWYITVEASYPNGELHIYPSCIGGITDTFPHQSCNAEVCKNQLWRKGKLCIDFQDRTLGINAPQHEPFSQEERLYWNVQRAIIWLRYAGDNALVTDGDPFEIPDFPIKKLYHHFAFWEDEVSMMIWESHKERYGIAKLSRKLISVDHQVWVVRCFQSINGSSLIYQPVWGTDINSSEIFEDALWLILENTPVVNIWQAPVSFFDLKTICKAQGIDFLEILQKFTPKARDGKPHLVIIGFPVPKKVGEKPCQIVWQAFELPTLSYQSYNNRKPRPGEKQLSYMMGTCNGFRPGEKGWWRNDKINILYDNMKLEWISSENWSAKALKGRGSLPNRVTSKRVALIGVGSLGSAIAELLVRSGITHIDCIDGEVLTAGNLCRHTLLLQDVYSFKSDKVVERLSNIDPNAVPKSICKELSLGAEGKIEPDLSCYDIIIDTTGENQVIDLLSRELKHETIACSCSVGLGAKRLYVNIQRSSFPNYDAFFKTISPYLSKDALEHDLAELPRESVGCWHPLFPARSDDIWLAACTAVKALDSFVQTGAEGNVTEVFESQEQDSLFAGFQLVEVQYEKGR